jgi:hypothetical protein
MLGIALACPALLAAPQPAPDVILFGGKIFTSDAAHSYVEALAIRNDRIIAVGDSAKIKALAGPQTKQIDLGGRTAIPGINDAHQHIGLNAPGTVELSLNTQDPTWAQLKQAISAAVAKTSKNAWITATIGPTAFHDLQITRSALDQLAPDRAVILATLTGHGAILNGAALAKAGIHEDVQDPVGGRYERSADGKLTGVLREYAVLQLGRTLGDMCSNAEALAQLRQFFSQSAKFGITSVQDMSDGIEPGRAARLFEEVPTPIRVRIMRMPMTTPSGRDTEEGLTVPRHPGALISVNGTKWLVDGVPLENTFTPRDVPSIPEGEPLDYAARHLPLNFPETEMEAMLRESLESNDPALFHISGYPGALAMLDAMEDTGGRQVWLGKRVRFEHGDGLFPDLIPRAKAMGIVVIQNPTHFDVSALFGRTPLKYKNVEPLRSLLAAGIPVALGSDGPMNPYLNIMLAVIDPGNPSEAITREQAVTAYTLTSAYAEFQEKNKGSLEPGKLADIAVLSQDIFTVPIPELPKTEAVLTMVGGKVVYDAHVLGR